VALEVGHRVEGQGLGVVGAVAAKDGQTIGDLGGDDLAGQRQAEIDSAADVVLAHAERDVLGLRRGELAAEAAGSGEDGKLDAVVEQLGQGLGGDLNVAVDEHGIELEARDFEQHGLVFLDDQAVAGLADDRVLLRDVENGHRGLPGLSQLEVGEEIEGRGKGWRDPLGPRAVERQVDGVLEENGAEELEACSKEVVRVFSRLSVSSSWPTR
jgi:hypothetical protein